MGRAIKKKARDRDLLQHGDAGSGRRGRRITSAEGTAVAGFTHPPCPPEALLHITSESSSSAASKHIPVLFAETLALLSLVPGGRYLDGTLGMGGHAEGLLRCAKAAGLPNVQLLGLDRDTDALALAIERLSPFGSAVHTAHSRFSNFENAMVGIGWDNLDGALIDIGVSSLQIDTADRGFSFAADGPLDMRMDAGEGESAWHLVNKAPVAALKDIIEAYGEDPMAGRIARAIDDARSAAPIETTGQLARIVDQAYPAKWRATSRNHPATRTFQALRMVVNNELGELSQFLERIIPRLRPGGRVAVITFHSLEDRMVKHFFREQASGCVCPRHTVACTCGRTSLRIITKKPISASVAEIAANGRAGSAKLRVAEKL